MKFNEKIVRLRKIKGITQDEFASAVGVSRQAVYKWECGQSYPEVAKLLEIKLLFGISIDDLLDENFEIALPEKKKRKRLTKTEKKAVEQEVLKEENIAPAEEKAEEPIAEVMPIEEEAPIVNDIPVSEKEPVTVAAAAEKAEVKAEEIMPEEIKPIEPSEDNAPQKKVGFFGRIFGRK